MASQPIAEVPTGPATITGQVLVAALTAAAGLSAVLGGDHSTATLVSLGAALVTAVTLMVGRYAQSVAQIRADATVRAAAAPSASATAAPGPIVVHCCCGCSPGSGCPPRSGG